MHRNKSPIQPAWTMKCACDSTLKTYRCICGTSVTVGRLLLIQCSLLSYRQISDRCTFMGYTDQANRLYLPAGSTCWLRASHRDQFGSNIFNNNVQTHTAQQTVLNTHQESLLNMTCAVCIKHKSDFYSHKGINHLQCPALVRAVSAFSYQQRHRIHKLLPVI